MFWGRLEITCPLPESTSKFTTQSQPQGTVNTQSIKILLGQIPNIDFAIGFLGGSDSKESAYSVGELCQEDPMEKGMAMHAGIPA